MVRCDQKIHIILVILSTLSHKSKKSKEKVSTPASQTSCVTHTLNLDVHDAVVVLDVMLNLTAIHSRVTGTQLRYPDASVCRGPRISYQLDSVLVVLSDMHFPPLGNNDGCGLFFSHKAPFDPMRQGGNGGSARVVNSVIL